MTPIANTMIGYITEEPNSYYHGKLVGMKPTFFLRVYYPMRKEGWTKTPEQTTDESRRTRKFPFVIHPRLLRQVQEGGPWKGRFVVVTYYPEVVERDKDEHTILLYATNVENLLADFPQALVANDGMWLDLNKIERPIDEAEL